MFIGINNTWGDLHYRKQRDSYNTTIEMEIGNGSSEISDLPFVVFYYVE